MPINNVTPIKAYTGNGVSNTFTMPFKIFAAADFVFTIDGVLKVFGADYALVGVGNDQFDVVTTVPPANLSAVLGYRQISYDRLTPDYQEGGDFLADTIDKDLDRMEGQVQQTVRDLGRAVKLPIDVLTNQLLASTIAQRVGQLLGFDSSGNAALFAPSGIGVAAVTAYMLTVLAAADAATARGLLSVSSTAQVAATIASALAAQYGAKGDQVIGTGALSSATKVVGAPGAISMARPASPYGIADVAALNKAIYGYTYANNGADNIDIAAGGAMDATGAYWITGAARTKNITTAWVVGNAQGGLDTGAVGNNDYYIWAIARSDTGVVDYLFSLSSTAPTMPANYDFKRLIGWFKRVGATNVAFTTYETEGGGLELLWTVPTLDINLANTLTTARRTDAVKVPLNFSVKALLNVALNDASAGFNAWVYCPDQADAAPSTTAAPLANFRANTLAINSEHDMWVRTSATGTIAARADLATVDLYAVSTMGFTWARRN